jgi:AcrR family transcriptional regulator
LERLSCSSTGVRPTLDDNLPTATRQERLISMSQRNPTSDHIDAAVDRMDALIEAHGFAGTSVDDLRAAADVSLRTLYRRYGSREQMIVAVLRNRAEKYLAHLAGTTGAHELIDRTRAWMDDARVLGCLFLRARADHPDDPHIEEAVVDYHTALHSRLRVIAEAEGLGENGADLLFIAHEGLLAGAPVLGADAACRAAHAAVAGMLQATSAAPAEPAVSV